ncbi:type VI secretion system tube protein Hcp [Thermomonas sp.]|uniref:Hcp family type VI secretion system effector n=1 Tax=Thermomonas sp. TaxID=1971895 RepID=UPI002487B675|nr:type VI secretion system tube protein Hcp [Thermomonas sp.]MDI1252943.1 type VI secretion system tube protein Hcp [Thermomonas sp.]
MPIDMFLELDGVKGESTDDKHPGTIELQSFSWGASSGVSIGSASTGGGVGKATFSEFNMTKAVDISSPKLALISARGEHIKKAKIYIRKSGGAAGQVDYQVYELDTIFVTGIQVSGGAGGEFHENLSLSPTKFKWEYKQQGDDGSLKGNMAVTVDRAKNTAV